MLDISERETRLLAALTGMAEQYLTSGGMLDTLCMGAGEGAIQVLEEYGLVEITHGGRCAVWTAEGRAFIDAH